MKKLSLKTTELVQAVRAAMAECKKQRAHFEAAEQEIQAKRERHAELLKDSKSEPAALARELSEITCLIEVLERRNVGRNGVEGEALEGLAKATTDLVGEVLGEVLARFDRQLDEVAARVAKSLDEQGLKALASALLESLPVVKERLRTASTMDTNYAAGEIEACVSILRGKLIPGNLPVSLKSVSEFVQRVQTATNAGNCQETGLGELGAPIGRFFLEHPEIKTIQESAAGGVVLAAEIAAKKSVYFNFADPGRRDADLAAAMARANQALELAAMVGA